MPGGPHKTLLVRWGLLGIFASVHDERIAFLRVEVGKLVGACTHEEITRWRTPFIFKLQCPQKQVLPLSLMVSQHRYRKSAWPLIQTRAPNIRNGIGFATVLMPTVVMPPRTDA